MCAEEEEEEVYIVPPYNENGHMVVQEAPSSSATKFAVYSLSLLLILPSQHTVWRSCNNDGTAASLTDRFVTLRPNTQPFATFRSAVKQKLRLPLISNQVQSDVLGLGLQVSKATKSS